MSIVQTGKRGRTIRLSATERVKLAKRLHAAMDEKGLTATQVAEASTLSPATVASRLRDTGKGHAGEHLAVWSLVALCDGLGLDPARTARALGVNITKADVAHSREVMEVRRARKSAPPVQPRARAPESNGTSTRLEAIVAEAAEKVTARVIDLELEGMVETVLERKLAELLA